MKNKMSKIIIFLFIYFLSLNSNASEQFNFDITEIEILENGNKFLGNKRGKISASVCGISRRNGDGKWPKR